MPVPLLGLKIEYVPTTALSSTFSKLKRRLPGRRWNRMSPSDRFREPPELKRSFDRNQDQKLLPRPTLFKLLIRKPFDRASRAGHPAARETAQPCKSQSCQVSKNSNRPERLALSSFDLLSFVKKSFEQMVELTKIWKCTSVSQTVKSLKAHRLDSLCYPKSRCR